MRIRREFNEIRGAEILFIDVFGHDAQQPPRFRNCVIHTGKGKTAASVNIKMYCECERKCNVESCIVCNF